MEDIDMYELKQRGPQNKTEELRIELCDKINALGIGAQGLGGLTTVLDVKINDVPDPCGVQAGGDDPELRRHPPRALRARRLRPGLHRAAGAVRAGPTCSGRRTPRSRRRVDLEHADARRSRFVEAGPDPAAERQDADRPRRRAQAHPGHAGQGRDIAGRLHQPRDLLRRPGRPGARRSGGPGRPDHRHAHGQVHRHDAGKDRPDRDDRQGRARPCRHRIDPEAQVGLPDGGRRRGLSGVQGDQERQGASASTTWAWKRSTSST